MEVGGVALFLRRQRRHRRLAAFREHHRNMRQLRDTSDPFNIPEVTFQGLYRLTQNLVLLLIEDLRPLLLVGQRSTCISLEIKVLCTLHFYAQGCYQRSAGSDRFISLSQPSVSRAVAEVTEALTTPQIFGKWVRFPNTPNERVEAIRRNYQATGIPGVLGYVDGTHVAIKAPKEGEHLYINRKRYHSVNVQIVSNSELRILGVLARFPGAAHDSFVWQFSALRNKLIGIWEGGERCWLLGDSGYPHEPWLQTPILNAAEGTPAANYTKLHVKARSAVERCIGLLKGRFRCLLLARKLEYELLKVCQITNACCVLHNICIQGGMLFDDNILQVEADLQPNMLQVEYARNTLREARLVQEELIRRL